MHISNAQWLHGAGSYFMGWQRTTECPPLQQFLQEISIGERLQNISDLTQSSLGQDRTREHSIVQPIPPHDVALDACLCCACITGISPHSGPVH